MKSGLLIFLCLFFCFHSAKGTEDDCVFRDSQSNLYDLTPLAETTFTTKLESGDTLFFSVCGKSEACDPGYSACVMDESGNFKNIGKTESYKLAVGGSDSLEASFSDGQGGRVSVAIECGTTMARGNLEIKAVSPLSSTDFTVSAKSVHGCMALQQPIDCTYTDSQGNKYDLTPLKGKSFSNSILDTSDVLYFSVCGDCSECEPGVSACVKKGEKSYSIGTTSSYRLDVGDTDSLELKLADADSKRHVEIFIQYDSKGKEKDLDIESITSFGNDGYVISSTSIYGAISNPPEVDCTYTDSQGNKYDLTPLKGKSFSNRIPDTSDVLHFSVCGDCSECEPGVSACIYKDGTSRQAIGLTSSYRLDVGDTDSLELKLSDADSKRHIEIFIQYDSKGKEKELKIESITPFENGGYMVSTTSVHGGIVNPHTADCTYIDSQGNKYDLTPLKGMVFTHSDPDTSDVLYFSVCGDCEKCEPGVAVCVYKEGTARQSFGLTSSYSLGLRTDGVLEVRVADTDSERHTEIAVACDPNGAKRSLVVNSVTPAEGSGFAIATRSVHGCTEDNQPTDRCFAGSRDISALAKEVFEGTETNGAHFSVSLCGTLPDEAAATAVVEVESQRMVVGTLDSRTTKDVENGIHMVEYTGTSKCGGKEASKTSIFLGCNSKVAKEVTQATFEESSCTLSLTIESKYLCDDYVPNDDDKKDGKQPFPVFLLITGIVVIAVVMYFCVGVLVNLFKGKTGIEVLPHYPYWSKCFGKRRERYTPLAIDETEAE